MNRLAKTLSRCAILMAALLGTSRAFAGQHDAGDAVHVSGACATVGAERVLLAEGVRPSDAVAVTGTGDTFTVRFTNRAGQPEATSFDATTLAAEGDAGPAAALARAPVATATAGEPGLEAWSGAGGVHWKLVRAGMPSASEWTIPDHGDVTDVSVAAVDAHRFVVVWVDAGGDAGATVRMETVRDDGQALGAPVTVATDAAMGTAEVAFAQGGRGVVTYVGATEAHFQIVAVPLRA